MLLAPPLLLLGLAHLGAFSHKANLGPAAGLMMLAGVWGVGMAALPASGWRLEVKIAAALAYTAAAVLFLPYLTLLAVCTTGDCI